MNTLDLRFVKTTPFIDGWSNNGVNAYAGQQVIVSSSPTGAFSGIEPNSLAYYNGSNWVFTYPDYNQCVIYPQDRTLQVYCFDGSNWNLLKDVANSLPQIDGIYFAQRNTKAEVNSANSNNAVPFGSGKVYMILSEKKLYSLGTYNNADAWSSASQTFEPGTYLFNDGSIYQIYTNANEQYEAVYISTVAENDIFYNSSDKCVYVVNNPYSIFTNAYALTRITTPSDTEFHYPAPSITGIVDKIYDSINVEGIQPASYAGEYLLIKDGTARVATQVMSEK